MTAITYPSTEWARVTPEQAGFDPEKLEDANRWLDGHMGDGGYRAVIVRCERIVAEWNHGVDRDEQLWMSSVTKPIFSCVLGIVIDEGKIPSADAKIVDYYPEAMDVPAGEGLEPGRYAFE